MLEMASDLGEKPLTVRKWHSRNSIPSGKWLGLLKAAKRRGIRIDADLLTRLAAAA